MDFKDYYQTLGVEKTASDKEIKSAYRKLARKHHPDVNPGDKASEAKFNAWRRNAEAFQEVSAFTFTVANLTSATDPEQIPIGRATSEFFHLFGASIAHGRAFAADEGRPGES